MTNQTPDQTPGLSVQHADALWDAIATPGPSRETFVEQHEGVCRVVARIIGELTPPADRTAEVDVDTVANRAAQVISNMGAEIRALRAERDRYRLAWQSARGRAQAYSEGVQRHVDERNFWKRQYDAEHTRHVEVVRALITDRAGVLQQTAEVLFQQAKHLTGEFNDSDVLHEDGPAATVATWKRAAELLRRMADEAQPATEVRTTYYIQSRPNQSQPWQEHGLRWSWESKPKALSKLATRREMQPDWEHRLVQRITTVTEEPLPVVEAQPAVEGWRGATEVISDEEVQRLAATGLVGYRQYRGRLLHCLHHKPVPASRCTDFHEVTADDLPDGGICVHPRCGADLLAVARP